MEVSLSNIIWHIAFTAFAYLCYEMVLKTYSSCKYNRVFFCLVLLMQFLVFVELPERIDFINIPGGQNTILLNSINTVESADGFSLPVSQLFLYVYFLGVVIGLAGFLKGLIEIFQIYRNSSTSERDGVRLTNKNSAFTFFNIIFMPQNVDEKVFKSIYVHECYHKDRLHSMDVLLWNLLSIIFWFNPFVHLLNVRQKENLEFASDEHSTALVDKQLYLDHLLKSLLQVYDKSFFLNFNQSKIQNRMKRILSKRFVDKKITTLTNGLAFMGMIVIIACTQISDKKEVLSADLTAQQETTDPKFEPNGHGAYLDSVLQIKFGDRFDDIDKDFRFNMTLGITINEKGKVVKVFEESVDIAEDNETVLYLKSALIEAIEEMPYWIPAKKNGSNVTATLYEDFDFSGEPQP